MVIVGIVFLIIGATSDQEGTIAGVIFGVIFLIVGIVIFILYLMVAKGIVNQKSWAKILGIILAILMLTSIPIGTVLGIILLINFFSDESKEWFEQAKTTTPPIE